MSDPIIKKINDRIYTLKQPVEGPVFVNVHLVVGERAALVDTGLASMFPGISRLIDEAGAASSLKYVVNTHAHHDHIGSNGQVKKAYDPILLAHRDSIPWIEDHDRHYREFALGFPEIIPDSEALRQEILPTLDEPTAVDVTLAEGTRISLGGGVVLETLELPGHLFGEVGFYEPSTRTLILGDAVIGLHLPFFHSYVMPRAYRETLSRLKGIGEERPVDTVLTGHYDPMDRGDFQRLVERAIDHIDQVEGAVDRAVAAAGRGPVRLADVWRNVSEALGKVADFRGLNMIHAILSERADEGRLRKESPYVWHTA